MNIIIPLMGHGSRFKDDGYISSKPLIKFQGKETIFWLIDNLLDQTHNIFIAYRSELDLERFSDKIFARYGSVVRTLPIDHNNLARLRNHFINSCDQDMQIIAKIAASLIFSCIPLQPRRHQLKLIELAKHCLNFKNE